MDFRHKNLAFCGKLSFVVNLRQIFLPAPPDVALGLRHFATRKIKFYIPDDNPGANFHWVMF